MTIPNDQKQKKEDMWMRTYEGNILYPYDLEEDQISILDIAHALSYTCRYSGHTQEFYSVSHHSILVSELVDEKYKKVALLHDAPEAYLRDIPRPVKVHLDGYNELEQNVWEVIASKFNLPKKIPKEVKRADRALVKVELRDVMDVSEDYFGIDLPTPDIEIESVKDADESKLDFLERYHQLK